MQCSPIAIFAAQVVGAAGLPFNKDLAMPMLSQTIVASQVYPIREDRLTLPFVEVLPETERKRRYVQIWSATDHPVCALSND
jgi:hypothetical protein